MYKQYVYLYIPGVGGMGAALLNICQIDARYFRRCPRGPPSEPRLGVIGNQSNPFKRSDGHARRQCNIVGNNVTRQCRIACFLSNYSKLIAKTYKYTVASCVP